MTLIRLIVSLVSVTSIVTANSVTWTHKDVMPESPGSMSGQTLSREAHVDNVGDFGFTEQKHAQQNAQRQNLQYAPTHQGHPSSHHVGIPTAYHYAIYPNYPTSGSYQTYQADASSSYPVIQNGGADARDGWLCRTFGELCDDENNRQGVGPEDEALGIAGGVAGVVAIIIAVLKALKLLPFVKILLPFTKFLPLLLPILPLLIVPFGLLFFPIVFAPLLLIIGIPLFIAAWFLPIVPVLVTARRLSVIGARGIQETLFSEKCLERVSCELSKFSRAYEYDAPWVQKFLDKVSPQTKWIDRITRAGRSAGTGCEPYTCNPVKTLKKIFKAD